MDTPTLSLSSSEVVVGGPIRCTLDLGGDEKAQPFRWWIYHQDLSYGPAQTNDGAIVFRIGTPGLALLQAVLERNGKPGFVAQAEVQVHPSYRQELDSLVACTGEVPDLVDGLVTRLMAHVRAWAELTTLSDDYQVWERLRGRLERNGYRNGSRAGAENKPASGKALRREIEHAIEWLARRMLDRALARNLRKPATRDQAFLRLFELYRWALEREIRKKGARHKDDIEEILDRSRIRAFERLGKYDPARGTFGAWLTRLGGRVAIDYLYREGGRRRPAGDRAATTAAKNVPPPASPAALLEQEEAWQRERPRMAPEERAIEKIKTDKPLNEGDLVALAVRNLSCPGSQLTGPRIRAEVQRIVDALAKEHKLTGTQLRALFPWHNPAQHCTVSRLSRLHLYLHEMTVSWGRLHHGQRLTIEEERQTDAVLRRAQELVRQVRAPGPGTVDLFASLQIAARAFLDDCAARSLSAGEKDSLGDFLHQFELFCIQFPLLFKLAACARLNRSLLDLPCFLEAVRSPHLQALSQELQALDDWIRQARRLDHLEKEDVACIRGVAREVSLALDHFRGMHWVRLALLSLWLEAFSSGTDLEGKRLEGAAPDHRLACVDRVWWLSRDTGLPAGLEELADELVAALHARNWQEVADKASDMIALLRQHPRTQVWPSAARELQDRLVQLTRLEEARAADAGA
jgi:DNA-directed RNA polymerase specialized sigma24 family protein